MISIRSRWLSSILSFLALVALVSPYSAAPLHPRQDSTTSGPPLAGILATIKSSTGTDITSNFQTVFFDGTDGVSNLTERQVASSVRPINSCRHDPGEFQYSECMYRAGVRHSLQQYRVRCKIPNPNAQAGGPSQVWMLELVSFAPSVPELPSLFERFRRGPPTKLS